MKPSEGIIILAWLLSVTGCMLIDRSDFYPLFAVYSIAFASYAYIAYKSRTFTFRTGLLIGFLCRILVWFTEPNLSDDYYRFIWDGMLMYEDIHPMSFTPAMIMQQQIIAGGESLFSLLNSPHYYSVYPPLAQFIHYVSFLINHMNIDGHILFFRLINLLSDGLIVFLLWSLLRWLNMDVRKVLLYAHNPLIIIELTGNLHMEGMMIAAFLAGILFVMQKRTYTSSIMMSVSIGFKMLTAMLIPFLWKEIEKSRRLAWFAACIIITTGLFYFFFAGKPGWFKSIGLWMQSFEFNASLYYIAREADAMWRGYPYIQFIGPVMAIAALLLVCLVWINYMKRKKFDWASAMVMAMTVFFLCSTTVHPWYLSTVLALSVLTRYAWPVVWSYLIFLSYSHYENGGCSEKYLFIMVEYALLFAWISFELFNKKIHARQNEFSSAIHQ